MTLPPVVSDPERCDSAIVGYNPPHVWKDCAMEVLGYDVCRFCGGRKP